MSSKVPYHALDADVIIIGAGVAGLVTAYSIIKKTPSLEVLIIEAADRTGGRTLSKPLLTKNKQFYCFDLGGQWISSQQKQLFQLINELDVNIQTVSSSGKIAVNFEGRRYLQNTKNLFGFCSVAAKLELANFIKKIENLCEETPLNPQIAAMNMEEFITQNISHDVNKAILEVTILVNFGVAAADVTLGFYIFFCISTHGVVNQLNLNNQGLHDCWVMDGAQEICNKLVALLHKDILLINNTKVLKITSNQRNVEVSTTSDVFYSTSVVVAIPPPNILKIHFNPPLPEPKLKILKNLVCGNLSKFVATYEKAFWREEDFKGVLILDKPSQNRPLVYCFETSEGSKPALAGRVVPNFGNSKEIILRQLALYFGNKVLEPLQFTLKNWNSGSPMTCYRFFNDVMKMQSRTDRIFFAGAETSVEWYGSICGAVISGIRAAKQVLYDIRPAALTVNDMSDLELPLHKLKARGRSNDTIYSKLSSRYYQFSAIALLALCVILWRKTHLHSRLKKLLIKT